MRNLSLLTVFFLTCSILFGVQTRMQNLKAVSEYHFNRLCELTEHDFENESFKVYEYDDMSEFRVVTGGSFFIKGFSNSRGIFLQSRYLLKDEFTDTLIHELLHALIKSQYPLPPWFEEGLVCLVTNEFSGVSGIPVMNDVENFETNKANNNWELLSYCLGCVQRVKAILGIE